MRRPALWVGVLVVLGHCLVGIGLLAGLVTSLHTKAAERIEPGNVTLWHLPNGAIQPQAAVDSKGAVHVIYFKNGSTDGAGDLYYIRMNPGQATATEPIRVNSQKDSAGSIGTVRTAHLAIGEGDRVHVAWNGLGPKGANGYPVTYEAYTRLNSAGTAFEPQRDLITWAKGLDGGGSVAADRSGNVYVVWHALANAKDETGRAVYVARSTDNGTNFSKEIVANPDPTGACGCCGLRAFVDRNGLLYVLYRTATDKVERDTALLLSRDKGRTFAEKRLHPWKINSCPMSTYAMTNGTSGVAAAWETEGHVFTSTINPQDLSITSPQQAPGSSQKHPTIAVAPSGQTLVAWTEGTGWQRGGALVWEVMDKEGTPVAKGRKPDAIPVWGLPSAYAKPDGTFVIVY